MDIKKQVINILAVYKQADSHEIESGLTWYYRANEIVKFLAEKYNKSAIQVAGTIAALSPGTSWHQNLIDTINILKLGNKARVTTYGQNKLKALRILDLQTHEAIYSELLHKSVINKTSQFYLNIVKPDSCEAVTIDRHAIRINYDEILNNTINLTPKRYKTALKAYQIAASKLNIKPQQLQAVTWITFKRLFDIPAKDRAIRLDEYIQARLDGIKNEIPF